MPTDDMPDEATEETTLSLYRIFLIFLFLFFHRLRSLTTAVSISKANVRKSLLRSAAGENRDGKNPPHRTSLSLLTAPLCTLDTHRVYVKFDG